MICASLHRLPAPSSVTPLQEYGYLMCALMKLANLGCLDWLLGPSMVALSVQRHARHVLCTAFVPTSTFLFGTLLGVLVPASR